MKSLLVVGILFLMPFISQAQSSQAFRVTVRTAVEVGNDAEAELEAAAQGKCLGYNVRRVSNIFSNYRSYHYYITVWADYVCLH